jgi:hypothetical protein
MNRNNKILIVPLLIIWLFISLFDINYYDFIEQFTVADWILNYYILLIIVSIIIGFLFSKRAIRIKRNMSRIKKFMIYSFITILLSFMSFALIFGLLQGGFLMTNRLIGKQKDCKINGEVINISKIRSKGSYHYYITVMDNSISRPLQFRVKREYQRGDKFDKLIKMGSLGLMYYKD